MQQVSAIIKYKYLEVVDEPIEITENGHYVLNSVTSSDQNNCYFIRSSTNPQQWFTIEYRNSDDFMENVPHSGVIIGRWYDNDNLLLYGDADFNNTTIPHLYWIFRPNSSNDITERRINDAAFGYDNRTAFGPTTNPHPYLTDGTPEESFEITNIQENGAELSFHVHFFGTSVDDHQTEIAQMDNHIAVHPNPTNNNLFVNGEDMQSLELFNTLGQRVLTQMVENGASAEISLSNLPAGIYLLRVKKNGGEVSVQKVVKQ
jgi:hypothetical protein